MAIAPTTQVTKKEITSGTGAWWCAGCGDFGVTAAHADELVRLVNEVGVPLENIVAVSGIGCSSKEPDMLHINAYHSQHGRSLPVALGIIAANPGLVVLDFGGDGDGYAIGMQHFVHAIRRNPNITYIVMNNQVYGLTKGQASPTAHKGLVTSSTPKGMKDRSVNPLMMGLSVGAAYVARGVSWHKKELQGLISRAIETRGFSLLDVFSPCVTYHREPGYRGSAKIPEWYDEHYIFEINSAYAEMRDLIVTEADHEALKAEMRKELRKKVPQLDQEAAQVVDVAEEILFKHIGRLPEDYDPRDANAAVRAMQLITSAKTRYGKEIVGELYINGEEPTMEDILGVSAEHAPAHADISVKANIEDYRSLLAELR